MAATETTTGSLITVDRPAEGFACRECGEEFKQDDLIYFVEDTQEGTHSKCDAPDAFGIVALEEGKLGTIGGGYALLPTGDSDRVVLKWDDGMVNEWDEVLPDERHGRIRLAQLKRWCVDYEATVDDDEWDGSTPDISDLPDFIAAVASIDGLIVRARELDDDFGSEEQIEAFNAVFFALDAAGILKEGQDEQFDIWCLKATSAEILDETERRFLGKVA